MNTITVTIYIIPALLLISLLASILLWIILHLKYKADELRDKMNNQSHVIGNLGLKADSLERENKSLKDAKLSLQEELLESLTSQLKHDKM